MEFLKDHGIKMLIVIITMMIFIYFLNKANEEKMKRSPAGGMG